MQRLVIFWTIFFVSTSSETSATPDLACPPVREDALNLHFIAHSHDDVGWVRTVEGYYVTEVRSILDTVIDQLLLNDTYRFSYTEMAFFHRWWIDQSPERQSQVSELVRAGRLQFALGGWVSSDEAVVHYSDAIDQLTKGRDYIHQLFEIPAALPKVAWQVDTFGHSREHAQIFYEGAYDALYFQRMHYHEKEQRRRNKKLQLLWNTDDLTAGHDARQMLTSILYYGYCFPWDVCLQTKCGLSPTNPKVSANSVNNFLHHVEEWAQAYRTNHILVPMGCDFSFTEANITFKAIDSLMNQIQGQRIGNKSINVIYSTPSCYTQALHKAWPPTEPLPQRDGDFFPYADKANAYWTGFYTSRPALKGFTRQMSLLLHMAEQLSVFAGISQDLSAIDDLRQQVAILQHHDAVTGTEKRLVAQSYVSDTHRSSQPVKQLLSGYVNRLSHVAVPVVVHFCDLRNISLCDTTYSLAEGQLASIFVYNPLAWDITEHVWIRIPVIVPPGQQLPRVRIQSSNEEDEERELATNLPIQWVSVSERIRQIPERQGLPTAAVNMELLFSPTMAHLPLPALGLRKFQLRLDPTETPNQPMEQPSSTSQIVYSLEHDEEAVYVMAVHRESGRQIRTRVELLQYLEKQFQNPHSGAYLFRPQAEAEPIGRPQIFESRDACVHEIRVKYEPWADFLVRRYVDNMVEVEWTVGPIPDDGRTVGREIICRYTIDQSSDWSDTGVFHTDSAGRRLIQRNRTSVHSGEEEDMLGIARMYYPIVNRIVLKESVDGSQTVPMAIGVYTDRAEGGSSLRPGQIELMLHRRLVRDDYLGVEEPLMENGADGKGLIVRGVHRFHLDELERFEATERLRAELITRPPALLVGSSSNDEFYSGNYQWSGLQRALPMHIHLLSLASWPLLQTKETQRQILIRLENMLSVDRTPESQYQPELLDITELFRGIRVTNATEMVITADETKAMFEAKRLHWPGQLSSTVTEESVSLSENRVKLRLLPDTIHTFILDFKQL